MNITQADIDNTIGQNTLKQGLVDMEPIYILQRNGVPVSLEIERPDVSKQYYCIKTEDVLKSSLTIEMLEDLKDIGFAYKNKEKKEIIKYISFK